MCLREIPQQTSEWTLDYPPFFAYFEWLLSQAAQYADPGMLDVKQLGYDSWQTVYFQRATVILTEGVLVYALHLCGPLGVKYLKLRLILASSFVKTSPPASKQLAHAAALSILLSPGLLIIDHIHFQYNGLLYGILILSFVLARKQQSLLLGGILFAALLCMKHIYLYLAPAYCIYLLRAYCLRSKSILQLRVPNILKLATGLSIIVGAAFGPILYWGQTEQLLGRLFPFSRGLCHAYWAPNFWAMYAFTDRLLIYGISK